MRLYSYSTRYDNILTPRNTGRRLMYGIESEMEPRPHASQRRLLEALGPDRTDMFCKADGSLSSGVELVTVPLTLEQAREIDWRRLFAPILPDAMAGARTNRCGMHIHINRAALSGLVQSRIMYTVNAPEMRPLIETIAQRTANHYCAIGRKRLRHVHNSFMDGPNGGSRYQAVNLTRHTLELRIFRGTVRYDRLLKNLDFADCLVHFSRNTSIRDAANPEAFTGYVRANSKRWPWLDAFLTETQPVT